MCIYFSFYIYIYMHMQHGFQANLSRGRGQHSCFSPRVGYGPYGHKHRFSWGELLNHWVLAPISDKAAKPQYFFSGT